MGRTPFGDAVARVLGPAMTERGFGDASGGLAPDGSTSYIFCAGAEDLTGRWPEVVRLLPIDAEDYRHRSACIDLIIDCSPGGALESVELEGAELSHLLEDVGLPDDAHRCSLAELQSVSAAEAVSRIRGVIETVLPLGEPAGG